MARQIGSLTPLALHVLVALAEGPRHGYAILRDIEERTAGALSLRSGTLYLTLRRLRDDGLLEEAPPPAESSDTRRRYFALTDTGRRLARREVEVLGTLLRDARSRLGSEA